MVSADGSNLGKKGGRKSTTRITTKFIIKFCHTFIFCTALPLSSGYNISVKYFFKINFVLLLCYVL